MTNMTVGQDFYQQQVAALEAQDVDALVAQYHEDAVMIGFDFTVRGHEAIRQHLTAYLTQLGGMKLVSTDRFAETDDSIFFEATVHTPLAEAKVYDVFLLRDGRATHQWTGVASVSSFSFPT
jgi:hypothetical protein